MPPTFFPYLSSRAKTIDLTIAAADTIGPQITDVPREETRKMIEIQGNPNILLEHTPK